MTYVVYVGIKKNIFLLAQVTLLWQLLRFKIQASFVFTLLFQGLAGTLGNALPTRALGYSFS